MLEERSCLVSRNYRRGRTWTCMNYRIDVNGKRPLENDKENELVPSKFARQSDGGCDRVDTALPLGVSSASCADEVGDRPADVVETSLTLGGDMLAPIGVADRQHNMEDNAEDSSLIPSIGRDNAISSLILGGDMLAPIGVADRQHNMEDNAEDSSLIPSIGRDNAISCLIHCSRSDYGVMSALNRSFRSLIRSGDIYKLRRMNGVVEHWVYFSCNLQEWEAFDPNRRRWMRLPTMNSNECFWFSDKESLAVGTELLVFGKELMAQVIYRYSLLTNSWSSGMQMKQPRCLFGSSSKGEIAIFAGGCDSHGKILSSAELYNSETGTWTLLPNMNKARKMCSGVLMDGKFYVVGGVGGPDSKLLTCGEEYDFEKRTWTEIPNMSPVRMAAVRENGLPATAEAPPLLAVVNNQLYAADYADMEVRRYDKDKKAWVTEGRLPERANSMNGWGLAFRACGDRLLVIGGPRTVGQGFIEVNSWVPSEGPPQWNMLGRKSSGSFVYNCAVMGC